MNSWEPFNSRVEYEFANYHFVEMQSLAANIDKALDLWAASVMEFRGDARWANSTDLYNTIDAVQHGPLPPGTPPKWMMETYQLLLHNQLATSDFFNGSGEHVWSNLMSADWSWSQADKIIEDATNKGAMFVPVIAGSDKTTVSVATGHQEYHPCAHGNSVLPVAFLPIPKSMALFSCFYIFAYQYIYSIKKHRKKANFQTFCRQMYHACLAHVFTPLKNGMTMPEVVKCPDGHFHHAVYGLGPYIADYLEQVWLATIVQGWCLKCDACPDNLDAPDFLISAWDPGILWTDFGVCADIVPFTHGFPHADIHELLTPNLLHQVIKGTFKDHLVMWVNEYLYKVHGEAQANDIIEDIDHRISAVPPFPGLQRFPDGRDFAQWTGDNSKALMKVYLSAVAGHIPSEMVKCISAFLEFCYIAQHNALTILTSKSSKMPSPTSTMTERYLQHSLMHYLHSIQLFGSPNGLCSSIMESKHINAIKEPWRHSSCYKALKRMLVTNSRLDKLASAGHIFSQLGMMEGMAPLYTAIILRGESPQPRTMEDKDDDDDVGPVSGPKSLSSIKLAQTVERGYPHSIKHLTNHIEQPKFPELLWCFLYNHVYPNVEIPSTDVDLNDCPYFGSNIYVFHSAIAHCYTPSDLCGVGGMYREQIRSNPNWQQEYARHDTMFVAVNPDIEGIDEDTGLWVVEPEFEGNRRRTLAIINLDCVAWAAHLLPVHGPSFIPEDLHFSDSLDAFHAFFVN
ncbi:hypothetical protein BJV74DRAFT_878857 [Russula compacta]|nr:hypothetical protein BJV74DRAFT_878857 [Russula compacta]